MKTARNYATTDLLLTGGFLFFGVYLLVSGLQLPEGAGFFPATLGVVTILLSLGLLLQSLRKPGEGVFAVRNVGVLLAIVALIGAYLATWGFGWFGLRTFLLLMIMLRMLGESWRAGIMVSGVLTIGVTAAFEYGLHVSLN
ncbi:MAG: tripartite tricarboxylate transporter TctB family protein [Opitutaceae bacterium]|nr:tripartite tricarboxylate transporter TctB family protein [Cephaloticoccus sp.]MCP5530456.1 tripartite tricarboxylate transporter TctB family protein [Opitutaceae bacterium]